ncbi:MAG: type II toxin-antitoxin system Phd/YefM family antitoxin [Gammaproteobacteria bacterium]|nr:type II toxin-antitoxin system Phd/YefM family antitoxin [Gammaproteobacteria bacterium]
MMHVWQLQEAKAKLTQLINRSKSEPQIISRHGVNESVVISMDQYLELCGAKENITTYFKNSPLYGIDIALERDQSSFRDTDL